MQAETVTTIINRPRPEVFAFINEIGNLPKWATEFAREIKVVDGDYKVITPDEELFISFDSDAARGVIDMRVGPTREELAIFPVRVFSLPNGATATTMTLVQTPDIDDTVFAQQIEQLKGETENLRRLLKG